MGGQQRRRRAASWFAAATGALAALPASADEEVDVRVRVSDAIAPECPDQAALVARVRSHRAASLLPPARGLSFDVSIDVEQAGLIGTIRVTGTREGIRTLREDGPDCQALADALAVTIAMILDEVAREDPDVPPSAVPESAVSETPDPPATGAATTEARAATTEAQPTDPPRERPADEPGRKTPPEPPAAETSEPRGPASDDELAPWIAAGPAATLNLPLEVSWAVSGKVGIDVGRVAIAAGGFWTQPRSVDFGPGSVEVRLLGATASGCGAFLTDGDVRADLCATAAAGELRGSGSGYEGNVTQRKLWISFGSSAMLRGRLAGPLGWGLTGTVVLPVWHQRFVVEPLGEAFGTAPISAWIATEALVKIP